jgi:hypothetical protein
MDDIGPIGYEFHPCAIGYEKCGTFWLCETVEGLIIVNSLLRASFSVTSRGHQAKNKKLKIPGPACSLFFRTRQPIYFHHASLSLPTLFLGLCFRVGEFGWLKKYRHRPDQVATATSTHSCMNDERRDAAHPQLGKNSATRLALRRHATDA